MNPKPAQQEFLANGGSVLEGYPQEAANSVRPIHVPQERAFTADLLMVVWRERWFVVKALMIGTVVAAVVSLLIPPRYESTTRIMPPAKEGLSGLASILAATAGDDKGGSLISGVMSNAMGLKTSGALVMGVLTSTTVQDELVDRFDLRKVYRVRYRKDARERLSDNTQIEEDRKSGIISVTVTDRSPQRATQMAKAYVDTLGELTAHLDTSAAHREKVFLEQRLKAVKQDLDTAAKDLSEFSSKNLTLDVREQGKAMVEGGAALIGEVVAAESQLSGLEQIYTANNVRVRSMQARVAELRRKLSELRGTNDDPPGVDGTNDFGVSITKLPLLGVTYYDLYRRLKIQETVFEVLTKQYELAKVEEAKEVPTFKVLDEAKEPETKASPKRILITLLGGMLAALMAVGYVMVSARFQRMSAAHPLSLFGLEVREGLSEDMAFLHSHTPKPLLRIASRLRSLSFSKAGPLPPSSD